MLLIYQWGGNVANSQFDYSQLEPLDEPSNTSQLPSINKAFGFNTSLLEPEEEKEQFLAPKKEGLGTTLPRDILIGLLNQRQNFVNMPHDIVQNIEKTGQGINKGIDEAFGLDKLNLRGPEYKISDYLPSEQNDFAKLMGQNGTPNTGSWLIQKGVEHAPEILSLASLMRSLPVTSRTIMTKMSKHKKLALNEAKQDYGQLFNEAAQQGITHAIPPVDILKNRKLINQNSSSKYHRLYNDFLQNPTLENAHWAQSELGSLERHLTQLESRTGLTPIQQKTLKAVKDTRDKIKQSMFNKNVMGSHPKFSEKYNQLSAKYKEKVIPYTRLEQLSEVEAKRMKPKTAVKELLNDDQFMIELSKRYPGLFLHTPTAKSIGKGAAKVGIGVAGYEGLKKLLK
jgi:hypothetical protein